MFSKVHGPWSCGPSPTSRPGGAVPAAEQVEEAETITVADYERAQSFLGVNTADLVSGNILAILAGLRSLDL